MPADAGESNSDSIFLPGAETAVATVPPEYNDYFCSQLTELLTGYGDIFYVWFDNACGEGSNGRKQEYDFPRYFSLIHKYQPNAVIFNDFGPDVRWCGNESGTARYAEWAVVPSELCFYAPVQTGPGPLAEEGSLSYLYNTEHEIGALPTILYSKGLSFVPSEIDMSIRPGWFWHPEEEPHSLKRLFRTYLTSCGANACLNLNIPPNRDGLLDEKDIARLKELRALIDREFGNPIPAKIEKEQGYGPTQPVYTLTLDMPRDTIKYIVLQEDISQGQRVESFRITAEYDREEQAFDYPVYQGTCIGHKKICQLADPFAEQNPLLATSPKRKIRKLRIQITAARDEVIMKDIAVF